MADDAVFTADPSNVQVGGGLNSRVGTLIWRAADGFESATYFNPQDPPWGNDATGRGFADNYVQPHSDYPTPWCGSPVP